MPSSFFITLVLGPVLLHLLEEKPALQQVLTDPFLRGHVLEESNISDDPFVKLSILGILAVEEIEWVNEERQIVDERDIESAVLIQSLRRHTEEIREVNIHTHRSVLWSEMEHRRKSAKPLGRCLL